MHDQSDAQLLRAYAELGTETAFAEIVTRHTDLVYSAALRQVNSPDLACDVTQSVFTDLARKAREVSFKPSPEASLVGWLYRGTRFAARDLNRTQIRRTRRERQAMDQVHPAPEPAPDWEQLRPALDDAMAELDAPDRDALLLRYFKNHDLRTVGATLGISDDAAQKRVSRAVERLREFFAKRGVTVGTSGLAVIISANAVQAAPVGLAVAITTAAALTGTTLATTATVTATKAIAMTALQKAIVTATIAGTGRSGNLRSPPSCTTA
ncbi:MAG: sigma-70 family RNA polymerase sigma factor [Verrucomicrobiota bacterium]